MSTFLALDFETANPSRDSACAIGLVRVHEGEIVHEESHYIRPPSSEFWFTYIHGITWNDVSDGPDFKQIWREISVQFRDIDFVAAHNAPFDRGVLAACCRTHGIRQPKTEFVCTVQVARRMWDLRPTKLPDVCNFLGLKLNHHHADSDARACAEIVIAAEADGWSF